MKIAFGACFVSLGLLCAVLAHGQQEDPLKDADLALGEKLIVEHKCAECHARKFGGDGSSVFRPAGRISTKSFLRGMVEMCNTDMNLGMFPEEVTSVAAVLNRDYYKFK
jgi:hypothetical protein